MSKADPHSSLASIHCSANACRILSRTFRKAPCRLTGFFGLAGKAAGMSSVDGSTGATKCAEAGISSHSCLENTRHIKNQGQRFVSMSTESRASAAEMGVFELLTITSRTSGSGCARRRARGEEPGLLGAPVEVMEKNLRQKNEDELLSGRSQRSLSADSHPDRFCHRFQSTQRTSPLQLDS